ncbi:hypothetical protein O181_086019, partial [Austropuccinia psidii MF-1]|nr:hypothetical protein [Austropuccinia psidii MF-1]
SPNYSKLCKTNFAQDRYRLLAPRPELDHQAKVSSPSGLGQRIGYCTLVAVGSFHSKSSFETPSFRIIVPKLLL